MPDRNATPQPPRAPRRVLVVEDEKNQRQMLTRALTEMEFQAAAVGSGEEALKILDEFAPTLAMLDLNLPGIGGLELASEIQKRQPQTRMIVLTGYGDLETARHAIRLDVVDFLLKPCPLGELEAAVSRAYQKAAQTLDDKHRPAVSPELAAGAAPPDDVKTIENAERRMIAEALTRHDGNRTAAARELGISVRTLYYRLSRYEAEDRFAEKQNK